MEQSLEQGLAQCIADLRDTKAGWVTRRDAAENLGKAARQALDCLRAHEQEADQDVRRTVIQALAHVGSTPAPPAAEPQPRNYTMEELLQAVEKPGKRAVSAHGDGFIIQFHLPENREQTVHIKPFAGTDGMQLIRLYTFCAEANEKIIGWAMRANVKLPHCAFAIHARDEKEWVVLAYNFDRERAKPEDFKAAAKAIAHYGDWFERHLTGMDEF